ncbi:hypothetical protein JMJ77_0008035 [Colletotrichum scovillei]|uniref:Uncharacterized protein n=1 Tax=Colletotrichum scovillei TaxID=1209932 RepID=A0A9P7RE41_9PEZI|nr:hypothetical protein JMJ77_0008035 [Colletotrichum scovillei]KAG7075024.1 hypothetical protein JMJ76_0011488 [Colletotrichum scovillei]KAG7081999.1 hypothetical protein JMJ78_0004107 [Colletotrichum scovillei]
MAPQRTYGYLTAFAVTSVNRSGLRNGMLGGGMACVVKMLADMLGLDAVAVCPTPRSHSSGT